MRLDHRHARHVEPFHLDQLETGLADGAHGVAVGMAPSSHPPPRTLQAILPPGQPGAFRPDVLEEELV